MSSREGNTRSQCCFLCRHGRKPYNLGSFPKTITQVDFMKCLQNELYKNNIYKASQAIQSPRIVPFFLLVSLLDGYSFPNVLVKGIVAFKH